ncbi:MAG: ComEC family competence protein [Saprospiraceae bacterium]|nr:ComEC family competence protein [Saprospiraceae bacterium]
MYPFVRKNPFVIVVIFLVSGILLANLVTGSAIVYYFMAMALLLVGIVMQIQNSVIQSLVILISICLFGISRTLQQDQYPDSHHYAEWMSQGENECIGVVKEPGRNKYIVDVELINQKEVHGKLLLFSGIPLIPGDRICFKSKFYPIQSPRNPYVFDARRYYGHKQIWYQTYLNQAPLRLNGHGGLYVWMHHTRNNFDRILHKHLITENEYALVKALLLGDKRELGTELKNAYADTGAMHVLAVSGLHVGVLYLILLFILKRLIPFSGAGKVLRSILILSGLWFFVYLVGAPNSAWRATLMFSLFEIGSLVSRSYYPVNTLSLAAVLLLLLDPNTLYDVGFQLSFLAVLGIVTCQREIQGFWKISNPVGFKVWQMISLSIAAQVFIFPLIFYYFHQFAVYFWLSGILAVPLAFIVILAGVLTLLFSWFPYVGVLFGYLLLGSSYVLNAWIFAVQQLPGMVVEGIWINGSQLALLFIISLGFVFLIKQVTYSRIRFFLLSIIIFLITLNIDRWKTLRQRYLIAYSERSDPCVDLVIGEEVYPLLRNYPNDQIPWEIKETRDALGIRRPGRRATGKNLFEQRGFWATGNYKIFLQDSLFAGLHLFPNVDYFFLNNAHELGQINSPQTFTKNLIGWKITKNYRDRLMAGAPIQLHDMYWDGTLIIDLNK